MLRETFSLWKKSYILLFPQILFIAFCFESYNFSHNIILAVFMYLPGIYLSNYLLLKLWDIAQNNNIYPEKYYYSQALVRLFDTLVLFLGLIIIFIIAVLTLGLLCGPLWGAVAALIILIIYSYMIFSYAFVVVKNQKPIEAIKSSVRLINQYIWLITGIFVTVGIIEGLIYLILLFLMGINISAVVYNLLFTSLNLAVYVTVIQQAE